jgi:hypothetical protein
MTTRMERKRKRVRTRRRRTDEVEEDLNVMGISNWHRVVTDRKEGRKENFNGSLGPQNSVLEEKK